MERHLQHGSCLVIGSKGVLLLGPPGAGKSSLALAVIDQAGFGLEGALLRATLVADDQVVITRKGSELEACAPQTLQGKIEVRGIGIFNTAFTASAVLALAVELKSESHIERLPEPRVFTCLGVQIPLISIDASNYLAPARLRAALCGLGSNI